MANSRIPGPQCTLRNPVDIHDGTLCRQASPRPGILGAWDSFESAVGYTANSVYDSASQMLEAGKTFAGSEYAIAGHYAQSILAKSEALLEELIREIKHAADWRTLNRIAEPILGQASFDAGVFYGLGEGLVNDVAQLLGLVKMVFLAGLYERLQHQQLSLMADPMGLPMLGLAKAMQMIPSLEAEMKKADELLRHMVKEVVEIAKNPGEFIHTFGGNIKKGVLDDLAKLKDYSEHRSVTNDFEAGKICGRAIYQIVMLILMVISVAGAAAKLAARIPWLMRLARVVKTGGALEDIEAIDKASQVGRTGEAGEAADASSARTRRGTTSGKSTETTSRAASEPKETSPKKSSEAVPEELIAQRRATAENFYRQQGFDDNATKDHLKGIDFTKPVEVTTLQPGTEVSQWQVPGRPQGNYYATPGTDPNTLGIRADGRIEKLYVVEEPVQVLKSTAADIPAWDGSGATYTGGSTQYFTASRGSFGPK